MFPENNRAERLRVKALRRQGLGDAELADIPPRRRPSSPRPEGADPLLDSVAVRAHLGGCSEMSLWRWTRNNGFPEPDLRLNGRKLWRLGTVDGWINAQNGNLILLGCDDERAVSYQALYRERREHRITKERLRATEERLRTLEAQIGERGAP